MKFTVKNLGRIDEAEYTLAPLTVICGLNNTGKTYITHATYAFLDFIRHSMPLTLPQTNLDELFTSGSTSFSLAPFRERINELLSSASKAFSRDIFKVFAGKAALFENASFSGSLLPNEMPSADKTESTTPIPDSDIQGKSFLQITIDTQSSVLSASIKPGSTGDGPIPASLVETLLADTVRTFLVSGVIPRPFISSTERTGAAIFQRELDFTRNRVVDALKSERLNMASFLGRFSADYPLAVRKNVDFIRELPNLRSRDSFIAKHHPDILADFERIISGRYLATDSEVMYIPSGSHSPRLRLVESSSSIRALLDIGFYLRHLAQNGDLLMVDEPELNLHPKNQRLLARLFAKLVNAGVKVFMTTHSDYIVREINNLLLLNQTGARFRKIASDFGYGDSELLSADQLRVYTAVQAKIVREGGKRKTACNTLQHVEVSPISGIALDTFDDTIDVMNEIRDRIEWDSENA